MSYAVDVDPLAQEQIAALPDSVLAALAEAFVRLRTHPWSGAPHNRSKPRGAMRTLPFGSTGLLSYLVVEDRRRVDVLTVMWAG